MSITYIHVNQNRIRSNLKHGTLDPVITIKSEKDNIYCHEVEILGPSKVVYHPMGETILVCGARVVIETEAKWRVVR